MFDMGSKSRCDVAQLDPAYQRMPSDAADEVGSGCLLLSHLRCRDDCAELMLDYSAIATAADDDVVASNASSSVSIQLLKGWSYLHSPTTLHYRLI